jgi:rRNA pseudouridine-1189 N-methylase Emg1 (Nep1/Mra1 family)
MPASATEAFETFTGVWDVKKEARMSRLMKKKDLQAALLEMEEEDLEVVFESNSETTATLMTHGMYTSASELLHRTSSEKKTT